MALLVQLGLRALLASQARLALLELPVLLG
jgi:hypothetical protein